MEVVVVREGPVITIVSRGGAWPEVVVLTVEVKVAVPRLMRAGWQVSAARSRHPIRKGTTNMKNYQTTTRRAGSTGGTTPKKA